MSAVEMAMMESITPYKNSAARQKQESYNYRSCFKTLHLHVLISFCKIKYSIHIFPHPKANYWEPDFQATWKKMV